jgi:pyridoxal/pyridoxine/pyridoxamine kinase
MNAFDIAIYGHLSFDNIYEGFEYKTSVGCMGNVWNQLKLINPDLKIKLDPTDIGESLIIANAEQCKRTSISRLSLKTHYPRIHDSKISHVMYINELSNTGWIKDLKGFVVADVCNGKELNVNDSCLEHIDLLLISDEEYNNLNDSQNLILNSKVSRILVHNPTGSYYIDCINNHTIQSFNAEFVPNINVVGAGDKFAAYILNGLLEETNDPSKVIQEAHNRLTEYFKNEKV